VAAESIVTARWKESDNQCAYLDLRQIPHSVVMANVIGSQPLAGRLPVERRLFPLPLLVFQFLIFRRYGVRGMFFAGTRAPSTNITNAFAQRSNSPSPIYEQPVRMGVMAAEEAQSSSAARRGAASTKLSVYHGR
jgi:hypothetical protein